jgi:predicted TIM-barrel fold metal-dependent hydrolase
MPLPALDDPEGPRVPSGLPEIVDAHVHLFPDRIFQAIWRWFDQYGWPIRYKIDAPSVVRFLLSRGVSRIVALHYAHKPGLARMMNAFMTELVKNEPRITGLATVMPGEPGARAILDDAFDAGLAGVKLHCHVQCFAADDDILADVYDACVARDMPLIMHAGREPKSDGLKCDPYAICSAERTARVLAAYPRLRLVIPHLGFDEFDAYEKLLERHENLWLDTTMMMSDYFEGLPVDLARLVAARADRVMYGTDFPNIPYAWDRELLRIAKLPDAALPGVLGENARRLFRM